MANNKWILQDNQHGKIISHYLAFSKCKSLNDLVSLGEIALETLLIRWGNSLIHKHKWNSVRSKLDTIVMFYSINDVTINILELEEVIQDNISHQLHPPSTT